MEMKTATIIRHCPLINIGILILSHKNFVSFVQIREIRDCFSTAFTWAWRNYSATEARTTNLEQERYCRHEQRLDEQHHPAHQHADHHAGDDI